MRGLEVEVAVWKQQAISQSAPDYDSKATSRRSVAFENDAGVSVVSSIRLRTNLTASPQNNLALCVIDGTRSVFSPNYLTQGEEGGRKAGQEIIRGITDHLAKDGSLQVANIKISIIIYVMRPRLRNELIASDTCTAEQFDGFFVGLNETRYLSVVEVGNKSDTDRKIEGGQQANQVETSLTFFT